DRRLDMGKGEEGSGEEGGRGCGDGGERAGRWNPITVRRPGWFCQGRARVSAVVAVDAGPRTQPLVPPLPAPPFPLPSRMERQLLHSPIEQFGNVELVLARTRNLVNPPELLHLL